MMLYATKQISALCRCKTLPFQSTSDIVEGYLNHAFFALEVREQSRLKCCLGRIVQVPCSGNYPKVPLASVVHTRPADFVSTVQC